MACAVAAEYWAVGLTLDYGAVPVVALLIPICLAASLLCYWCRLNHKLVYGTETVAQILLISFLGGLLTYGAAAAGFPYRDAELLAADRWLGFDIKAYLAYLDAHPFLAALFPRVYLSIMRQPIIVVAALTLTGRLERLHDFSVALIVSLIVTIAIFTLVPAISWYAFLHIDGDAFPNLVIFTDFAAHLDDVRTGSLQAISLADLRGIIAFPSFHAAAAVLGAWAFWPLRFLRWPMLVVNALMVVATPIVGVHYLVDVVGGLAVGGVAVLAAFWTRRMLRRLHAVRDSERSATRERVPDRGTIEAGAT